MISSRGPEAPMQRAGASTQHARARGVDAGRGADAGPGGVQLERLNTDSLLGRGRGMVASGTHPLAFDALHAQEKQVRFSHTVVTNYITCWEACVTFQICIPQPTNLNCF